MASRKRRDKSGKKTPKQSTSSTSNPESPAKAPRGKEDKGVLGTTGRATRSSVAKNEALAASTEDPSSQDEEITEEHVADVLKALEGLGEEDETDCTEVKEEPTEKAKGSLSLDVLAWVASEKFTKEPVSDANKKLTQRHVQSLELLNVDQIRLLSDKALVNLFGEPSSNELKRNYTYTCSLMPKKCSAQFSSFGNEQRARQSLCSHLRDHIEKLMNDEDAKAKFSAEPIHARKRRMTVATKYTKLLRKKKIAATSAKASASGSKVSKVMQDPYHLLRTRKVKDLLVLPKGKIIEIADFMAKERKKKQKENEERNYSLQPKKNSKKKKNSARRFAMKKCLKSHRKELHEDGMSTDSAESTLIDVEGDDGKDPLSAVRKQEETDKCIAVNDQFIIDLLSRSQPHHDHCYTTIFGKRRGADMVHYDVPTSDEESEDTHCSRTSALKFNKHQCFAPLSNSLSWKITHSYVPSGSSTSVPVIQYARLAFAPDGTPLVSAEEEVQDFNSNTTPESSSAQRPYPPMPKFELARKGKIFVPEEMVSSGDEAERLLEHLTKRRQKSKPKEGTAEWERKTALRCIRELRTKKPKDDKAPLICKICKDKTFTAAATLMYHYRSHAGIKPFVCLICNTTFTRQHSLNYHMLIHNNQSRFTCVHCGRKFRHPSHFKEHIRRHTGECPFVCTDCPLKFKTRNTYKRHLKTRHAKLLTASGIHHMSEEEFRKFQTKPYKKRVEMPPIPVDENVENQGSGESGGNLTTDGKIKTLIITPEGKITVGTCEEGEEGSLMQFGSGDKDSEGAVSIDVEDDSEDMDDGFSDASIDNDEEGLEDDVELLDIS